MKKIAAAIITVLMFVQLLAVSSYAETEYTEGTLYYVVNDSSVTITGYFGTNENVYIPDIITGLPVTGIAPGAFEDTAAVKVYLPSTIEKVESGAIGKDVELVYSDHTVVTTTATPPPTPTPTPIVMPEAVDIISPETEEILTGQTLYIDRGDEDAGLQLAAMVQPEDASPDVTWKSSAPTIAAVDQTGLVTPKNVGTATITATAAGGKTAKVTVKVSALVHSIEITGSESVAVGKTTTLKALVQPGSAANKAVTWASSDPAVAAVSSTGVVTGKSLGTAVITATAKDGSGIIGTKEISVVPLVTEVRIIDSITGNDVTGETLVRDMIEFAAEYAESGEVSYQLSAVAQPADANQSMKWTSSSTTIAAVNADTGLVKFLKPGTVTITATARDGSAKKATVKLTLTGFTASTDVPAIGLQVGKTAAISVLDANKAPVSDPTLFDYTVKTGAAFLSVDENGVITGKAPGTATVTAALRGDPLRRSVTVSVKVIPVQTDKVELTADNYSVRYLGDIETVITEGLYGIDADGNIAESEETTVGYALYLNKSTAAQTRTILISALDSLGNQIAGKGKFTWKSGNTALLTVKENADGNCLITVKAKAAGAATVTATSKDLAKLKGSITVYVMDYTPKLGAASVTINTYNDEFVTVPLNEYYRNAVTGDIEVYEYNSKTRKYDIESTRISVVKDEETGNLKISANKVIPNGTINTQLKVACVNGEEYYLKLKVVSKATVPTVKFSKSTLTLSSIFKARTDETAVKLNQPLGIELKGYTATAVPRGMTIDEVNEMFTLVLDPETNMLTASKKDRNAPNGTYTFAVTFTVTGANGNTSDVKTTLKITVNSTLPTAKYSKSALTLSSIFKARTDETTVILSQFGGLVLKLDDWTANVVPKGMTADEVKNKFNFVLDPLTNVLTASQDGSVPNGTYTFAVNYTVTDADGNSAPANATLKVTVNSTLPTVKLSKSTLTLSSIFKARTDETVITLNQPLDVTAVNAVLTAAPSGVNKAETQDKFNFVLDSENNLLTISQDGTLRNGTYTFAVTFTAADKAGNSAPVKATLKVTVNSTLPTVKLSKSTLTLSSVSTAKTDETTVTLNQPLDVTAVNAVLTAAPSGVNKTEANKKFTFTTAENVLTVSQDGTLKNGTYTFAVTLTVEDAAGNAADVKTTLRVTVNAKP